MPSRRSLSLSIHLGLRAGVPVCVNDLLLISYVIIITYEYEYKRHEQVALKLLKAKNNHTLSILPHIHDQLITLSHLRC